MVSPSVRVKVDAVALKMIVAKKQKLFRDNMISVLKNDALPKLIDQIMVGYDNLSNIAEFRPDDPTNPANWRELFLDKLHQDLERNFIVSGNSIVVRLGEKRFLGYAPSEEIDPADNSSLHWLVFYLEGLVGDWAFISPDTYKKITGRDYKLEWGRFSDGFMISKDNYDANGWDRKIPFAQVRHPFSGLSPVDIFTEALREFNLRLFVQKAVIAAYQGRKI